MLPIITKEKRIDWKLTTMRYYYPSDSISESDNLNILKLNSEDPGFIFEHSKYKEFLSVDYLKERIEKSYSACIRESGKLVAWGLTHDDGALGSLQVMDEQRKKGYGRAILISLIEKCLQDKKIPFAQIEENNLPAVKLVRQLGFIEDRRVTWLKLK